MIRQYAINDVLDLPSQYLPYFVGTFEGTEDPDIEWPHRHSFYSLVWFTEGTGFYVVDFEEYDIKPDRIFLVNPRQIHNWDYSENSKGYILTVDQSLGADLHIDYSFPCIDMKGETKELASLIFPNLMKSFQAGDDIKIDIRYVYQLVARAAAINQEKTYLPDNNMERFKELIAAEFSTIQTVEEYADKLHLSPDELNLLCKHHTGESAKQFVLDIKITEAKRLLLYSTYHINEIAFRLGFEDSSYFSRIFKKKTLYSPSDFLKKYRKQG